MNTIYTLKLFTCNVARAIDGIELANHKSNTYYKKKQTRLILVLNFYYNFEC